jgi:hypothetical protein
VAYLRSCGEHPRNFEVVSRDCQLGSFALHEEFVLENPEDEDAIAEPTITNA